MPVLKIKNNNGWVELTDLTLSTLTIGNTTLKELEQDDKNEKRICIDEEVLAYKTDITDNTIDSIPVKWENNKLYYTNNNSSKNYFITNENISEVNEQYQENTIMQGEYSLITKKDISITIGNKKAHCFITALKDENDSDGTDSKKITLIGTNLNFDSKDFEKDNNTNNNNYYINLPINQTLEFNIYPHNNQKYIMVHLWK